MNRLPLRCATLALAAAVAAGCASNDARDENAYATRDETTTVTRAESTHVPRGPSVSTPTDDALVGVPACDDYLSSYRACHAVIGAYAQDVLDQRYDDLRRTLVSQSRDPEIATTLEARCNGLIAQRDEALAGRACLPPEPAVATSDADDDLFDDGE